jgi:hypothetical protein
MHTRTASCTCGQLRIEVQGEPRGVGVAVGAFADPAFAPPQVSVYDCRRHAWVRLPDGVTAFDKDPM